MNRGAVVLGVDYYPHGGLAQLKAAVSGAKQIAEWARKNGITVELLTATGPSDTFTYTDAYNAVLRFVDRRGSDMLDQLIVYFGGHGVNIQGDEVWVLPDAPRNNAEAINLSGATTLARLCGIPHVVFISDACRTHPASLTQGLIGGGDLFPNDDRGLGPNEIDRFFAARVGNPSQEVPVPLRQAKSYQSVFTTCLVGALTGAVPDIIEDLAENGSTVSVIAPRKLKSYLETAVPRRVADLKLKRNQIPAAYVETVMPPRYLSRLAGVVHGGGGGGGFSEPPAPPSRPDTIGRDLLHFGLSSTEPLDELSRTMRTVDREGLRPDEVFERTLVAEATTLESATGRPRFETGAGFTLHGAQVARADGHDVVCHPFEEDGASHVSVGDLASPGQDHPLRRPVSVLMEFENGRGCVLPALPGFVGTAVLQDSELVNVSYEPVAGSGLWQMHSEEAQRLKRLRSLVAAASRERVFRVERDSASALAEQIRYLKSIDPTLGMYAAYAYHEAGMLGQVEEVAYIMRSQLSVSLFDVFMLAKRPSPQRVELSTAEVIPFCPMLSQGWALLSAKGVRLPEPIEATRQHLSSSLWTLFEPPAVRVLRDAMLSGGVE